jgi:predicted DNA-binding protein YlxM (UPF0122 family)
MKPKMRFIDFLGKAHLHENHYGSLINQDKYNELNSADKALYKYTADGFTAIDGHMDKLNKKYPYEGGTLYRGLHFDTQEQYDKFFDNFNGTITLGGFSSWSSDKETAKDFSLSKKTYFPTIEVMRAHKRMTDTNDHMTGYGGIVLKTHVTSAAKGVDVNKSGFAKESEVILPAGTYEVTIEHESIPFHRKYKNINDFEHVFADIKKKYKSESITKILNYLFTHFSEHLTEKQADLIANYMFGDTINSIANNPGEYVTVSIKKDLYDTKYTLNINVFTPGFDERILSKCSDAFKRKIELAFNKLCPYLGHKISSILSDEHIDEISQYNISGISQLMKLSKTKAAAAVKPLKLHLSQEYARMNSRAYLKTITDDDMKAYTEKIKNLLAAIVSLEK